MPGAIANRQSPIAYRLSPIAYRLSALWPSKLSPCQASPLSGYLLGATMDKLLLIDDEADVQYSFRRIFDSPDLQLFTASSGEEGVQMISRVKPDLVISDIRMAGINGLETLRRIRQLDPKLPVILMTAYGTTQTAIEAMKLGAYDYLLKPFDVPKLKELVAQALRAARESRQAISCSRCWKRRTTNWESSDAAR